MLRTEALRAVRQLGPDALATVREGLRRVDLIGIDDGTADGDAALIRPAHRSFWVGSAVRAIAPRISAAQS